MVSSPLMKGRIGYSSNIAQLAQRIESDIRKRDLAEGERYLNAGEAARRFRVSTNSANRALQLLAHKQVLTRRQRAGTFIRLADNGRAVHRQIGRVHLLVHERYLKEEGVLTDGIVLGIQSTLPGATIEFNFIPPDDEAGFVRSLLKEAMNSELTHVFVLVRASLACQRAIARAGLPAVVHGTPYPSIPISSLDRDWEQAAALAIEYLVKAKCRRYLVLSREIGSPGLHRSIDAIRNQLESKGVTQSQCVVRSLPTDDEVVTAEIEEVLRDHPRDKLAVIGLSEPLCEAALKHLKSPDGPRAGYEVLSLIHYKRAGRPDPGYTHLMPVGTAEQMGADIGRILLKDEPGGDEEIHMRYPMRLVCPGQAQCQTQ